MQLEKLNSSFYIILSNNLVNMDKVNDLLNEGQESQDVFLFPSNLSM